MKLFIERNVWPEESIINALRIDDQNRMRQDEINSVVIEDNDEETCV